MMRFNEEELDNFMKDIREATGKEYHPGLTPYYLNDPEYRALQIIYKEGEIKNENDN